MGERTEQKIKKENKKAFVKFAVILGIAMIFGGILGGMTQLFQEDLGWILETGLSQSINRISTYGIYISSILFLTASWIVYFQCKSQLKKKEEDEDELLDRVEMKLSYPLLFSSILLILDFFFFAGSITNIADLRRVGVTLAGFVISIGAIIVIQQKTIDLLKVLNPEKKGSVYDVNFSRKWEESCDEAEKSQIYKAGYSAFHPTMMACIILWLVLVLAGNICDIGILPVACVTIIWMVQTVSYCIASIKMTKKKHGKMDD